MGVALLIFFGYFYYLTLDFPDAAATYPRMLILLGAILSAALLIKSFVSKKVEKMPLDINKPNAIRMLIAFVLMVACYIICKINRSSWESGMNYSM